MKTVNLEDGKIDLAEAIDLARQEPLLLVTPTGQEFVLAEADDFDREVETLRNSVDFQHFLDERLQSPHRIALEEIEAEIDGELARQRKTTSS
jgi:PHD/YefM family antitoxin component YafN of YafNO toxin-antitoxin module